MRLGKSESRNRNLFLLDIDDPRQRLPRVIFMLVGALGGFVALTRYYPIARDFMLGTNKFSDLAWLLLILVPYTLLTGRKVYYQFIKLRVLGSLAIFMFGYGSYVLASAIVEVALNYELVLISIVLVAFIIRFVWICRKTQHITLRQPLGAIVYAVGIVLLYSFLFYYYQWYLSPLEINQSFKPSDNYREALLKSAAYVMNVARGLDNASHYSNHDYDMLINFAKLTGVGLIFGLAKVFSNYTEGVRDAKFMDFVKASWKPALVIFGVVFTLGIFNNKLFVGAIVVGFGLLGVWITLHMCNATEKVFYNVFGVVFSLISIGTLSFGFSLIYLEYVGSLNMEGTMLKLFVPVFGSDDFQRTFNEGLPVFVVLTHYVSLYLSSSLFLGKLFSLTDDKQLKKAARNALANPESD